MRYLPRMNEESQSDAASDLYGFVVGATLAQIREKHGWMQGELARRVSVTQSMISRIEHGHASPDAYLLRSLAHQFGMTTSELHALIDDADQRATEAAKNSLGQAPKADWLKNALAVAGAVGLAGLAGFAVAMALHDADQKPTRDERQSPEHAARRTKKKR